MILIKMKPNNEEKYLTPRGLANLKNELNHLKDVERKEMAERLKQAISFGDLSENAAYSVAKDAQADLERKIIEMEILSRNAIIIEKKNEGIVQIGSTIKLKSGNKKFQYTIVGSKEADPENNFISNESPLGKAFLNKKKGEIIEIQTPRGVFRYEIIAIE